MKLTESLVRCIVPLESASGSSILGPQCEGLFFYVLKRTVGIAAHRSVAISLHRIYTTTASSFSSAT